MRIPAFLALVATALGCLAPARAHDLPFTGNRAAEEAMAIERAARLGDPATERADKFFSLVASKVRWNRSVLDVCFWNGDPALRARVSQTADELTASLPVKFRWGGDCPGPTTSGGPWERVPVRVSLTTDAALLAPGDVASSFFALIGREAEAAFDRRATVNLPFTSPPGQSLLRSKVLHEFCHVLGCLHEHQRAGCADLFDKQAIMAAFNLSETLYRQNFQLLPTGSVYGPTSLGALDPDSVMLYTFRRDIFVAGSSPTCIRDAPATSASPLDLKGLQRLYAQPFVPGLKLADFPMLEVRNRRLASARREMTNGYSAVLKERPSSHGDATLRSVIASLSAQADAFDREAAGFSTSPEEKATLEAALALLPRD